MNASWTDRLKSAFRIQISGKLPKVDTGIYHYRREADGNVTRFHLRVEEDGRGLLVANASVGAILSSSGVWIAKSLLDGKSREMIHESLRNYFHETRTDQISKDIEKLDEFIRTLANPEDNYPIFNLDDPEWGKPKRFFAPYHAQLSVSSPENVRPLLEKLWNSGFLQVTFSASRNDSAKDTVLCVERAEDTGMICGVRACGTWLQTPNLLQDLATAGVDSIVAPVASSSPEKHDALFGIGDFEKVGQSFAECKKWEVCPVAEVPLFQGSWKELKEILAMLGNQGVRNVLYYAIAEKPAELALRGPEIIQAAVEVEEYAAFSNVRYVWGVPLVREGNLQQIVEKGPRTPQDLSILVEADGSVYLSRGAKKPAGNILRNSWKEIWNGELCQEYKKRILSPTHCDICPGLAICAADCPGEPSGWAREEV